uniref:RING-type domain-containing protein n=1 Tax=Panagrellus redivivus TaxID=6233 RepID=A0A7E4VDR5_PANRE
MFSCGVYRAISPVGWTGTKKNILLIQMSTPTANPLSAEMASDIEMSRCSVCYCTYNRTNRAPISMTCGHTFCHGCIRHMTTETLFSCAVCRAISPVGWTATKKNILLIKALEKLNLLASDDTNEVLDSSPLGTNKFIKNELQNVDSKDMLHYGKHTLDFLAGYLKLRYGFNAAVKDMQTAILIWECLHNVFTADVNDYIDDPNAELIAALTLSAVGADLLHKITLISKTLDFLNARIDGLFGYSSIDAVAAPIDRIENAPERKEINEDSDTASDVNGKHISDYSSGGLQRKITSINECLVSMEALLDHKFAV